MKNYLQKKSEDLLNNNFRKMGITKIGKISRVVSGKPTGDQGPASMQPGTPSGSTGIPTPGQTGTPTSISSPKKGPGTVVLRPEDRLPTEMIERIEEMIKRGGGEWNAESRGAELPK